jgi:hypothetical protein
MDVSPSSVEHKPQLGRQGLASIAEMAGPDHGIAQILRAALGRAAKDDDVVKLCLIRLGARSCPRA